MKDAKIPLFIIYLFILYFIYYFGLTFGSTMLSYSRNMKFNHLYSCDGYRENEFIYYNDKETLIAL